MITTYLFESPGTIIIVLAIAWMLMRIIGRRGDKKRLLQVSWVVLLLVGAVWLTATLVTTPREELEVTLKDLLLAVEDKDFAEFSQIVQPAAMTHFMGEEFAREEVQSRLERAKIKDLLLLGATVEVDSPAQGTTYIRVRADGEVQGVPGMQISEWAIRWQYKDGRWQAQRFRCTAFGADAIFNNNKPDEAPN